MWVYFVGKSADNDSDPLYIGNGERERITKTCPTTMVQETVEKWLRMGRIIERITLISDDDVRDEPSGDHDDTGQYAVITDDQIEAIRHLRAGGVWEVEVEKDCPNGDKVVSQGRNGRTYRLWRIEQSGTLIADDIIR